MSLVLREVARFLLGAAAWVGATVLVSQAAALPFLASSQPSRRRSIAAVAFVGAAVAAALAIRFSAPLAWAPAIGHRPLPVAWSAAGAIVAAGTSRLAGR